MKLGVWNNAIELFKIVNKKIGRILKHDFKLKAQILDSLGSCGELLTRLIGLRTIDLISLEIFEEIDKLHYEVENKLLVLIKALQAKKDKGGWDEKIHEPNESYNGNVE